MSNIRGNMLWNQVMGAETIAFINSSVHRSSESTFQATTIKLRSTPGSEKIMQQLALILLLGHVTDISLPVSKVFSQSHVGANDQKQVARGGDSSCMLSN